MEANRKERKVRKSSTRKRPKSRESSSERRYNSSEWSEADKKQKSDTENYTDNYDSGPDERSKQPQPLRRSQDDFKDLKYGNMIGGEGGTEDMAKLGDGDRSQVKDAKQAAESYMRLAASKAGWRPPYNEPRAAIVKLPSAAGQSCAQVYRHYCAQYRMRANAAVLRRLSDKADDFTMARLVLTDAYIGNKGLLPVIEVARLCPQLLELNLAGNGIATEGIEWLVEMAVTHPTLHNIDLSRNPHVTLAAARMLEYLVGQNGRMCTLSLADTNITEGYKKRVQAVVHANAKAGKK